MEDECLSRKMRFNRGGTRMIWRNVMEAALLGALRDVTSVSFSTFSMLDHDGILMLSVQSKTESSNWTTWDVDFLPRIATMAVVGEAMVPPMRCIWWRIWSSFVMGVELMDKRLGSFDTFSAQSVASVAWGIMSIMADALSLYAD